MARAGRRLRDWLRREDRAAVAVETAIVFPLLIGLGLTVWEFSLYRHAQDVVTAAVQDGAQVAASTDAGVPDGVMQAQAMLDAGLPKGVADVKLQGIDHGNQVAVKATGTFHLFVPWFEQVTLPLQEESVMSKERFTVGPDQ